MVTHIRLLEFQYIVKLKYSGNVMKLMDGFMFYIISPHLQHLDRFLV